MRSRPLLLLPAMAIAILVGALPTSSATAATSANGLIAFNSYKTADGDIYVVSPDGTGEVNVTGDQPEGESFDDQGPDWSPDGSRIAFTRYSMDGCDIYVIEADGTDLTPILESGGTFEERRCASQPDWSPDGSRFAFVSDRDGNLEVFVMNADGSDVVQLTHTSGATRHVNPQWSPDGTRIAFASDRDAPGQDLFVMDADGSNVVNLTNSGTWDVQNWNPSWSPDASRLAYTQVANVRTGADTVETRADIRLLALDGTSDVAVTDTATEWEASPAFSPDGTQISFVRTIQVQEPYPHSESDVWVADVPASAPAARTTSRSGAGAEADVPAARQVTTNGSAAQPDWQAVSTVDEVAPVTSIAKPKHAATYAAGTLQRFSGTALDGGSGIASVQITLRKRLVDGTCKWWNGSRFVSNGSCRKAIWLTATGTGTWAYRLPAPLGASRATYTIRSRAHDVAGNVETTFAQGRNSNSFRVV